MNKVDVMTDKRFIHGGDIFYLNNKSIIACVDPSVALNRKGICKSNSVSISFISDSPIVTIEYSIVDRQMGDFTHTGITVQCGISYSYKIEGESIWHNLDCYCGRGDKQCISLHMSRYIPEGKSYEMRIYGPVFGYLSEVTVSVDDGFEIVPVLEEKSRVCFLGGVTTFGAGVTSSAGMFTNIMKRKYPIEIKNISFYWWNWMDKFKQFLEKIESQINDSELIFMECDSAKLPLEIIENNLDDVIDFLLKKTKAKIILWNQPEFLIDDTSERKNYINKIIDSFVKTYPNRVFLCDNYKEWSEEQRDEYSNGKYFLNESGNIFIFNRLRSYVEELCQST